MAEKEGGATKAAAPPRLALPPRPTGENLFRGGVGAAGVSGVSPGPMTLVSSFFAEEPESDCRSFLQLLAGAMASPAAAVGGGALAALPSSASGEERERLPAASIESTLSPPVEREKKSVDGDVGPQRPQGLGAPFFMLPPIPSPTGLLESPTFFLPGQGSFGISHQQALAQVTAQALQAAQAHGSSHLPAEQSPALPPPASSSVGTGTARPAAVATADGYNWRKYGQKKVKCSEFPRSYYKCTHPNCQVKKKVEKSLDGQVVEITYKGQHSHPLPSSGKRPRAGAAAAAAPPGGGGAPEGSSPPPSDPTEAEEGNLDGEDEPVGSGEASRSRSEGGQIVEQLSGLSDVEDMDEAEVRTGRGKDPRQDPKRRKMEAQPGEAAAAAAAAAAATMSKVAVPVEPKIIVQTTSEVDLLDDGYRWRKYGQKVVKGNPNPRSYYKCTSPGCNARKHIERSSADRNVVITTYERKHNHGVPGARTGGHGQVTDAAAAAAEGL